MHAVIERVGRDRQPLSCRHVQQGRVVADAQHHIRPMALHGTYANACNQIELTCSAKSLSHVALRRATSVELQ
jgi:hypothetical protein